MLQKSAHEFTDKVSKIKLGGLQRYAGIQGSSTSQGEQLLNLRRVCVRLLEAVSSGSLKADLEAVLHDIDGQIRLAISTGLISGAETSEFSKLVDNLYEAMEAN